MTWLCRIGWHRWQKWSAPAASGDFMNQTEILSMPAGVEMDGKVTLTERIVDAIRALRDLERGD